MSADTIATAITEPGIYDLSEQDYHADPVPGGSLSSTGARKLLPPSCPARFAWGREHPAEPKQVFDIGAAAHQLVLGSGRPLAVLDAKDWRTKTAQEWRDGVRAEGSIPLLAADHEQVTAMAEALRAHPLASAALDPARGGKPEQSLFMQDEASGVWLRSRLDWMPDPDGPVRPVIFDYKTTASAQPDAFAKSMANYGYHLQAAFYAHVYLEITGVNAPFLFIAQEKEAPYLVTVCQPDAGAMKAGRELMRQAIDVYAACAAVDDWPGYTDDIATISLPPWARAREDYL